MRMQWIEFVILAAACGLGACSSSSGGSPQATTGFEEAANAPGKTPPGWTAGENMGTGKPAQWVVESDASAPRDPHILTVRTENAEATFNWCVLDGVGAADVEVSALVKPVSGADDQGGGVLLRFQDANNYYVARWNPLEENVRIYVVRDGVRTRFGNADTKATPGWRRLVVRAVGAQFEVLFDGQSVITAKDESIRTSGKAGLWTKADATTSFDDFAILKL